jgi:hypothetical protein
MTDPKDKPARRPDGVFMWGDIVDADLVIDLVSFLHQSRRSVALTVVNGALRKSIYFRKGSLIAASSNRPEDRFGDVTYRKGLITRPQLAAALADVGPGRRIGNVLLAQGAITGSDLWKIIKAQIEEIVYSVLLVEEGQYTIADYDPSQVPTRTSVEAQHVLLEGLRRKDELKQLAGQIPDGDQTLVRSGWSAAAARLEGMEAAVYELVDGQRTVSELLRDSGLGAFTATQAVHRLIRASLITEAAASLPPEKPEASHSAAGIIGGFNEAFAMVQRTMGSAGATVSSGINADFFADMDLHVASLFVGIEPHRDGRLPADPLYLNLKTSGAPDALQALRRGLRAYLRFLLFAAREVLPYDQVEQLVSDVLDLVRDL